MAIMSGSSPPSLAYTAIANDTLFAASRSPSPDRRPRRDLDLHFAVHGRISPASRHCTLLAVVAARPVLQLRALRHTVAPAAVRGTVQPARPAHLFQAAVRRVSLPWSWAILPSIERVDNVLDSSPWDTSTGKKLPSLPGNCL